MTTEEPDNGWESLAEEFGLETAKPEPKVETPAPARSAPRPAATRPARATQPEIEEDADDFGAGVTEEPSGRAALYDPGPDTVSDDADDFDDSAPEPMEDEGEESPAAGDSSAEGEGESEGEGGKRRRRRRRRKKKGAPGAPEDDAEPTPADQAEEDSIVEEGEAPAEVESDDDEPAVPSAVEEELDAEAAGPQPEWHVMTWAELVSKLYRPN
jgi:hypothetical protein